MLQWVRVITYLILKPFCKQCTQNSEEQGPLNSEYFDGAFLQYAAVDVINNPMWIIHNKKKKNQNEKQKGEQKNECKRAYRSILER